MYSVMWDPCMYTLLNMIEAEREKEEKLTSEQTVRTETTRMEKKFISNCFGFFVQLLLVRRMCSLQFPSNYRPEEAKKKAREN